MSGIADKNPTIEAVLAHQILEIISELRNAPASEDMARAAEGICYHAGKIEALVRRGAPIQLVLPAFPAKSVPELDVRIVDPQPVPGHPGVLFPEEGTAQSCLAAQTPRYADGTYRVYGPPGR